MADQTKIEWADATLNYANGCSRVSPGCGGPGPHGGCYAEQLAGTRLRNHPSRAGLTKQTSAGPRWTGEVRMHEPALQQALAWKRGRKIFWNAHGDLFHEKVTDEQIDRLFAVCALTPQHTHMILTKRSARMREYMTKLSAVWHDAGDPFDDRIGTLLVELSGSPCAIGMWEEQFILPNVWLGVSVEDQQRADERIPDLLATPSAVRFISAEPLLGPVDLTEVSDCATALDPECWGDCACDSLYGYDPGCRRNGGNGSLTRKIDWVIAGGESGPKARPMHPEWPRSLRDQCQAAGVPFLFKQWGEWAPICEMSEALIDGCYNPAPERNPEARRRLKVDQCVLHGDGTRFDSDAMFKRPAFEQGSRAMTMMRIRKKAAGRTLGGRTHDEFPA
jgi:protein gp37